MELGREQSRKERLSNKLQSVHNKSRNDEDSTPSTLRCDSPSSNSDSSNSSTPNSTPKRYRSLNDIYATCNYCSIEQENFEEAFKQEAWRKVMNEEIQVIEKNQTWELVDKPKDKDVIGVKWIYKVKHNPDGSVQRNKARLSTKGYSQ